jgi:RecB family exonuclease
MLTEYPEPVAYTIYLNDGKSLIHYFVTDASARRWAQISKLAAQITKVTRNIESATFVIYSQDNSSDNSAI